MAYLEKLKKAVLLLDRNLEEKVLSCIPYYSFF